MPQRHPRTWGHFSVIRRSLCRDLSGLSCCHAVLRRGLCSCSALIDTWAAGLWAACLVLAWCVWSLFAESHVLTLPIFAFLLWERSWLRVLRGMPCRPALHFESSGSKPLSVLPAVRGRLSAELLLLKCSQSVQLLFILCFQWIHHSMDVFFELSQQLKSSPDLLWVALGIVSVWKKLKPSHGFRKVYSNSNYFLSAEYFCVRTCIIMCFNKVNIPIYMQLCTVSKFSTGGKRV